MIVMSAETAERVEKQKAEAVREVQPATKADVDRLFDEIRRLQDTVSLLVRSEGWGGTVKIGDGGSGG